MKNKFEPGKNVKNRSDKDCRCGCQKVATLTEEVETHKNGNVVIFDNITDQKEFVKRKTELVNILFRQSSLFEE